MKECCFAFQLSMFNLRAFRFDCAKGLYRPVERPRNDKSLRLRQEVAVIMTCLSPRSSLDAKGNANPLLRTAARGAGSVGGILYDKAMPLFSTAAFTIALSSWRCGDVNSKMSPSRATAAITATRSPKNVGDV